MLLSTVFISYFTGATPFLPILIHALHVGAANVVTPLQHL